MIPSRGSESSLQSVLDKLESVGRNGEGYLACCPAHDDSTPSLSISVGDDGRVLLKCFAGCPANAIVGAIGMKMADLFPKDRTKPAASSNGKPGYSQASDVVSMYVGKLGQWAKRWPYHNAAGETVGFVIRWDKHDGTKEIRPVAKLADGLWHAKQMPAPRPLYRLPELLATEGHVVVCEGEKAVDSAASIGLLATTSAGGAEAFKHTDWRPLAGKSVFIARDNDEAGLTYARGVSAILSKLSPPADVKTVLLPGLPDGGDIYDWIEAHGDAAEPDAMRDEFYTLAVNATDEAASDDARYVFMSSRAFADADFRSEFLIENVLTRGEPGAWAGPVKTYKTCTLVDAGISLATGTDFLGTFRVPQPRRTVIVSGESGYATLQRHARAVCNAKGVNLRDLGDMLLWCDMLPQLTDEADMHDFTTKLLALKPEVLFLDPFYLAAGNVDARNMFEMGPALRSIAISLVKAGVTPIICHHANRQLARGKYMELTDLSHSGLDAFVRQFLLLNWRGDFRKGEPNSVYASIGGSAGHGGKFILEIDEGDLDTRFEGRTWAVTVTKDSFEDRSEQRERQKDERETTKRAEQNNELLEAIDYVMTDGSPAATKTKLRDRLGWNGKKLDEVIDRLLEYGKIEVYSYKVKIGRGATRDCDGYRRPVESEQLSFVTSGPSGQTLENPDSPDDPDEVKDHPDEYHPDTPPFRGVSGSPDVPEHPATGDGPEADTPPQAKPKKDRKPAARQRRGAKP